MNEDKIKYILICSCFNMGKKATQAFNVLFPNEILPNIVKGKDRIYKLAQDIKNDHISAIAKLSGKFAFYIELKDGKIVKEYNLLTGKRVA